ncbi:hypothetical protein EVAR_81061_1 [Eumeta japonica]|uniref:Uncharacterized protein n=1 Tax=Eumeta variegata TaxID=151549 RepID=A0A4C1T8G5_EUMVA|nr:hypothetical protein EVAR_81061_1 [Eumeta japonica]
MRIARGVLYRRVSRIKSIISYRDEIDRGRDAERKAKPVSSVKTGTGSKSRSKIRIESRSDIGIMTDSVMGDVENERILSMPKRVKSRAKPSLQTPRLKTKTNSNIRERCGLKDVVTRVERAISESRPGLYVNHARRCRKSSWRRALHRRGAHNITLIQCFGRGKGGEGHGRLSLWLDGESR